MIKCAQYLDVFCGATFPHATVLRPATFVPVELTVAAGFDDLPPTLLMGRRIGRMRHINGTKMMSKV
jgi:hypothetical protein